RAKRGVILGNNGAGVVTYEAWALELQDVELDGEASFAQPVGLSFPGATGGEASHDVYFRGCSFGATVGHSTADIQFPSGVNGQKVDLVLDNSPLLSTTPTLNTPVVGSRIAYQREGGTAGNHR